MSLFVFTAEIVSALWRSTMNCLESLAVGRAKNNAFTGCLAASECVKERIALSQNSEFYIPSQLDLASSWIGNDGRMSETVA